MKSSGWLADKEDFTDGVLTKLVIQDFRATLNSIHLAIFDQCLLGDKTIRAFAEEYGCENPPYGTLPMHSEKNAKNFCDSPDKRQKNVRCKVKGQTRPASQHLENRISSAADLSSFLEATCLLPPRPSYGKRAINREAKLPCGAAVRHDGEVGYNDTSVPGLPGAARSVPRRGEIPMIPINRW